MMQKIPVLALLAVLLLALTLLGAGCLSIPGPEEAKKIPAVTTVQTSSPVPVEKTSVVPTPAARRTVSPATTPVPAPTLTGVTGTSGTCPQLGGTEAQPGYQCTGTWLSASDTFSCCSTTPVFTPAGNANESVITIPPAFSLSVNLDDSPGSITP